MIPSFSALVSCFSLAYIKQYMANTHAGQGKYARENFRPFSSSSSGILSNLTDIADNLDDINSPRSVHHRPYDEESHVNSNQPHHPAYELPGLRIGAVIRRYDSIRTNTSADKRSSNTKLSMAKARLSVARCPLVLWKTLFCRVLGTTVVSRNKTTS